MVAALGSHFLAFAETTRRRAPLYSRVSAGIAGSPLLAELYRDAPPPARVPVTLFAAVQYLLMAEPTAPLARFYPHLADAAHAGGPSGDPVAAFLDFCAGHAEEIRALVATRLPQTNEVGRSALLVAGLGQLPAGPVALLDVGASAGLNLLLDRFAYADGAGNVLGRSELELACVVRGVRPGAATSHGLADRLPLVSARAGLDANPVDLADPDAARWVEACVWADQADRFRRLQRAVELFRADPVPVHAGDAVGDVAAALSGLARDALPVVTTTWTLSYLPIERQWAFVAELERIAASSDLAWVWAEAPNQVGVLPVADDLAGSPLTVLGVTSWRSGRRTDRVLATCHQHGYWLGWR